LGTKLISYWVLHYLTSIPINAILVSRREYQGKSKSFRTVDTQGKLGFLLRSRPFGT